MRKAIAVLFANTRSSPRSARKYARASSCSPFSMAGAAPLFPRNAGSGRINNHHTLPPRILQGAVFLRRFQPPAPSPVPLPAIRHSLKNAVTFPLLRSRKVLAALTARLAEQGFAGHLIPLEAGFAPSSSPHDAQRFTPGEHSLARCEGPANISQALLSLLILKQRRISPPWAAARGSWRCPRRREYNRSSPRRCTADRPPDQNSRCR